MNLWCRCSTVSNKIFNLETAISFTTNGKRNFKVLESQNRDNRSQSYASRDFCPA